MHMHKIILTEVRELVYSHSCPTNCMGVSTKAMTDLKLVCEGSFVFCGKCHEVYHCMHVHTDVRDKYNRSPLHSACQGGNIKVVKYLVEERKLSVGEWLRNQIGFSFLPISTIIIISIITA